MDSEHWQRLEVLYHAALEQPADVRHAFLDKACGGNNVLYHEVLSLLNAEPSLVQFLEPAGFAAACAPVSPGRRLGPYLIDAPIGVGGMGEVFRATDSRLHRTVAIKVLSANSLTDVDSKQRFIQEARAVSALNHPNIVVLYDISHDNGTDFLVMEYVRGKTLHELIPPGGLRPSDLFRFGSQAAAALVAAHGAGIVHRDIKPANIMITSEGQVKVLDFGLAKLSRCSLPELLSTGETPAKTGGDTRPGMILGTVSYMSPEQTRGEPLDGRSDLFSLGSVLFLAATGRPPFSGASTLNIMHEIATVHPPLPGTLRGDLPPQFDLILQRTLAKDKEHRYASAHELLKAFQGLSQDERGPARPSGPSAPPLLVGRETELSGLQRMFHAALEGSGRFVLLSGEAGIGKSALARTFLHQCQQRQPELLVGHGACVEQSRGGEAYLPFLQAMSRLMAGGGHEHVITIMRRYAPTWCLQFPSLFSDDSINQLERETIGATRERMLRELGDAFEAVTSRYPVLILLEDLHWVDAASIDLIRHLGQRSRSQRLLLLGTARPEEQDRGYALIKNCKRELIAQSACEEIALDVLRPEDTTRYLNEYFSPNRFPGELAGIIHAKTEGHPLFITGVLQLLAERGHVAKQDGAWELTQSYSHISLSVPASVRSMIDKRLEVLEEVDRRTLQFASVQGEEFLSIALATSLEMDELALEERLGRLERLHRLVRSRGEEELPDGSLTARFRFSHALYQSCLYADLLPKRRVLLHRQAAETLARCYCGHTARVAAALAIHFEQGRDFPLAIEYLTQAGDNATALLVHSQACEHFSHALELCEKLHDNSQSDNRMVLYKRRGDSYLVRGLALDAEADYRALHTEAVSANHAEWEGRALTDLANVHLYTRKPFEMADCAKGALIVAERTGNLALRSEANGLLAASCQVVGRVEEARAIFAESIPSARAEGHLPALLQSLTYQGVAHFFRSQYEEAVRAETEALQLAADSRNGFYWALSRTYLGFSLANLGRISEALAALDGALDLARRNDNRIVLTRAPNGLGWIHREIGGLAKAIEFDESCAEAATRTGAHEAAANSFINLVYDYTLAGEPAKAIAAMRRVEMIFDSEIWNRWRFYEVRYQAAVAEFAISRGDLDRAEEHAQRLLANSTRYGVPKYAGEAYRILSEIRDVLGDHSGAEEAIDNSLKCFGSITAPLVEWRSHAALGRVLSRAGKRPAAARRAFGGAAKLVSQIAAAITESELQAKFLAGDEVRRVLAESGQE